GEADRETLVSMGVIRDDERIEIFYASGFLSIRDGGVLITSDRLVRYDLDANVEECELAGIRAIHFTPAGSWVGEGHFQVERDDRSVLSFIIDGMDAGDEMFHKTLRRLADRAREAAGKPLTQDSDAAEGGP
ncbi:MAG: hypothetical protein GY953_48185, partial [bacterium]|nr:hypothetical protein [bacterium]